MSTSPRVQGFHFCWKTRSQVPDASDMIAIFWRVSPRLKRRGFPRFPPISEPDPDYPAVHSSPNMLFDISGTSLVHWL
ncbi:hypothetical protein ACFXTO_043598 [Malus domestica]